MPNVNRPTYVGAPKTAEQKVEQRIKDIYYHKYVFERSNEEPYRLTFGRLIDEIEVKSDEMMAINENVLAWIGISQITIDALNQLIKTKQIFPVIADPKQFVKYCYNKRLLAVPMTLDPNAELDGVHWCPIEFIFTKPLLDFDFKNAKELE